MIIDEVLKETESRMSKSINALETELKSIRIGKASPALVENLKVEYYGNKVPLNQVANISAPEPRLLVIQPWEKNMVGEINKMIRMSNLDLNPNSDGNIIRIPIPPLSEERRRDTVKLVKKIGEESKIAIRNIRRDANDKLKTAQKNKDISEDDQRKGQEKVQELTDKYIEKVDSILEKKEKEILEV